MLARQAVVFHFTKAATGKYSAQDLSNVKTTPEERSARMYEDAVGSPGDYRCRFQVTQFVAAYPRSARHNGKWRIVHSQVEATQAATPANSRLSRTLRPSRHEFP